jgi:integrase
VVSDASAHADIRTTMNVYGKAMDAGKREAHGKVVRMVLAAKVA